MLRSFVFYDVFCDISLDNEADLVKCAMFIFFCYTPELCGIMQLNETVNEKASSSS